MARRIHTPEEIREICGKAGSLGRVKGWCQNDFVNERGEMCLVALINTVLGHRVTDQLPRQIRWRVHDYLVRAHPSYATHVRALRAQHDGDGQWVPTNGTLFSWNDQAGRTAADVLGSLEAIGRESQELDDNDEVFARLFAGLQGTTATEANELVLV